MFCFQCEQTAGCTGCTGNTGVCGKKADTAQLQDELTGALIGLARAVDDTSAVSKKTWQTIIEGLFTTITNVSFDNAAIEDMIQKVRAEKDSLVGDCNKCQSPCGRTDEYDMQQLWNADEDIRSLKSLILFGIRGMAAYAYHAYVLNFEDPEVNQFFCEALFKIGYAESMDELLPTVLKVGEINLKCMALLDKANTQTYGTPEPTDVTLTVEKGPFIVVTGHDLKDLQLLLEQTNGKGINIYTHGEMLPAHAYPLLKKFPHLKGNFGTAWQNQQKEFDHIPAPILYTTNCLMPPKSSYIDRVFTTEVVAFPGTVHIDEQKDFTPVIEKALELGGYKEMEEKNMFCFQCEQTAGCTGCTGNTGVCGKKADTAQLQDELTGALIGLARAVDDTSAVSKKTWQTIIEGLFTTITNVSFDNAAIEDMIQKVRAEKDSLVGDCNKCQSPCGRTDEYDMQQLWNADEDIRSLKSLILFGIRGMAAYAYHAYVLNFEDPEVNQFFCEALFKIGYAESMDELLPTVLKVGEINLKCMALLDKANTQTYGTPEPTDVTLTVEKGPFIVVTGHDLKDLQLLLEQTNGKGINIYTHGEMLPAHAYPLLKKFPHLKGNFGTAWQNQQKEFDHIPAPILYTTNCLMPPKSSYIDRVFTTEVVAFPGTVHIDEQKDFTPVIEKALELGGYKEDQTFTGINGGTQVTTGFGHSAILSHADTVIEAVKSGAIRHFFLVAGCDGAKPGRNYYTEFVKQTPSDSIVLTLACGKFRFNDLSLGEIGGLPRLMDMGQCNDAYGAIQVAIALADAFGCSVNELPLSFVLSWYEQKAVCILLTLLHLGIKNIRLGPSLPAFLSPNILNFLVENYGIAPITTPEEDIKVLLKQ